MVNSIIVFLGPPGSGKGTLAKYCAARYGWHHIATGTLCRFYASLSNDFGKKIAEEINKGNFVPDELITEMLAAEIEKISLQEGGEKTVIIDGFPRTERQIISFYTLFRNYFLNKKVIFVIFELFDEIALSRIKKRVICINPLCEAIYSEADFLENASFSCASCGGALIKRNDDEEGIIKDRLLKYHQNSALVLTFLKENNIFHIFFSAQGERQSVIDRFVSMLSSCKHFC